MAKEDIFRTGDRESIWKKYAGFLDLSLEEFMEIQEHLLLEELELIGKTILGQKLMNGTKPLSSAEFRQSVPLTNYQEYAPFLGEKDDSVLSEKPAFWVHTSGRSGSQKWIPFTSQGHRRAIDDIVAIFLLACSARRGDVRMRGNEHLLYNAPPIPYFSGMVAETLPQLYDFRAIMPAERGKDLGFQERIAESYRLSLRPGIELLGSLTTVLIKIGEGFEQGSRNMRFSPFLLHPAVLLRIIKGMIRSKLKGRNLMPKDLWSVKAIICGGTDTTIYRKQVVHYWGKEPHELYASTEGGFMATQNWTKKGMTFFPLSDFYEFIPEDEWLANRQDNTHQPSTVLLNGVEQGKRYELVITNFYGMPLLRYRTGDLIKIVSLRDEEAGINLPQMVFESRADDLIDIGGFTRLDEKTVWQAIAESGVKYTEWTIRKEYEENKPILHLYIELKEERSPAEVEHMVGSSLKTVSTDFHNLDKMLGIQPLRVTLLPAGTFMRFYNEQQAKGADLAHLKPAHMNAPESIMEIVLHAAGQG